MKDRPEFQVDPHFSLSYNPLRDPYLVDFFERKSVRRALLSVGKIENGHILIDDDKYYRRIALQERASEAKRHLVELQDREIIEQHHKAEMREKWAKNSEKQREIVRNRQAVGMERRRFLREKSPNFSEKSRGNSPEKSPEKSRGISPGKTVLPMLSPVGSKNIRKWNRPEQSLSPYENHSKKPFFPTPPQENVARRLSVLLAESNSRHDAGGSSHHHGAEHSQGEEARPTTAPALRFGGLDKGKKKKQRRKKRRKSSSNNNTGTGSASYDHAGGYSRSKSRESSASALSDRSTHSHPGGADPDWDERELAGDYDRMIRSRQLNSANPVPVFRSPRGTASPALDWLVLGLRAPEVAAKIAGKTPTAPPNKNKNTPRGKLSESILAKFMEEQQRAEEQAKLEKQRIEEARERARIERMTTRRYHGPGAGPNLHSQAGSTAPSIAGAAAAAVAVSSMHGPAHATHQPSTMGIGATPSTPEPSRASATAAIVAADATPSAKPEEPPRDERLREMQHELEELLAQDNNDSAFAQNVIADLRRAIRMEEMRLDHLEAAEEEEKRQKALRARAAQQGPPSRATSAKGLTSMPASSPSTLAPGTPGDGAGAAGSEAAPASRAGSRRPSIAQPETADSATEDGALVDDGASSSAASARRDEVNLVEFVTSGDFHGLDEALRRGVDVNRADPSGKTVLIEAASVGDIEMLSLVLKYRPDMAACTDDGDTALHAAVNSSKENVTVLQLLLDNGVLVNSCDNNGRTPIFYSVSNGWVETTKALLAAGASPEIVDSAGESAVSRAQLVGDTRIISLLESYGVGVQKKSSEDAEDSDKPEEPAAGAASRSRSELIAQIPVILRVTALGQFQGDPGELVFTKGTVIEVIATSEDGWWTGRLADGMVGRFPVTYTTGNAVRTATSFECVRCVADYQPVEGDEIPIKKNDLIVVLQKDPSGWWYARNPQGQTGLVPSNYCVAI